eukprot:jgi/Chrpa1/27864/Chrysochromulina_OHIO_Genome00002094-RA
MPPSVDTRRPPEHTSISPSSSWSTELLPLPTSPMSRHSCPALTLMLRFVRAKGSSPSAALVLALALPLVLAASDEVPLAVAASEEVPLAVAAEAPTRTSTLGSSVCEIGSSVCEVGSSVCLLSSEPSADAATGPGLAGSAGFLGDRVTSTPALDVATVVDGRSRVQVAVTASNLIISPCKACWSFQKAWLNSGGVAQPVASGSSKKRSQRRKETLASSKDLTARGNTLNCFTSTLQRPRTAYARSMLRAALSRASSMA